MKKLSLLFTLTLAAICTTGCDALDGFFDGSTVPADTEKQEVEPEEKEEEKEEESGEEQKEEEETVKVSSIALTENSTSISLDNKYYRIDYDVLPAEVNQDVTFTCKNEDIATVDERGFIDPLSAGDTIIVLTSVEDTSVTANFALNVFDPEEQVINYEVSFFANGGEGEMEDVETTGSLYVLPECVFTYEGYKFVGWALNGPSGTLYDIGDVIENISDDIYLYATWEEIPDPVEDNFTVSFNSNGGSGSMSQQLTNGSSYDVPECLFTRSNYAFDCWALNSTSGTKYNPHDTINDITSNITLYAIWEEDVTPPPQTNYTVTFNANGGSGSMSAQQTTGSTYVVPSCSFTYANHTFNGWTLNSPSGAKYNVGSTISSISSNIVLYANWLDDTPVDDSFYAECEGLTGSALSNKLYQIDQPKSPSYDWSRYEDADEAEDDSSSILCVYTRHNIKKSSHCGDYAWDRWNREHVWTQSLWPESKTDNHNIFACEGQINNYRGNLIYDEGGEIVTVFGHVTECKLVKNVSFEPCDAAKGEIARSVMYGAIIYKRDLTGEIKSVELALKWHLEHSITSRETKRNEVVYGNQGNRNMFVDHPEYACKIWGGTNSTTRSLCGM